MNTIKKYVLNILAKILLGDQFWNTVKQEVTILLDLDMSGEDKRKKAFEVLKTQFRDQSNSLINAGIELAVVWVKNKTKTE